MKAKPTGYLWVKFKCFLICGCQDMDLELENIAEILHFEEILVFDLLPHPGAWKEGSDVMEGKPTLQGTYGLSINIF